METKLFVIEESIQGKLHPNSESGETKDIALDFINTWTLNQSEDSLNARANGKNCIVLKANKAIQFTVGMEVMSEGTMLMLLGATKGTDGKIHVGSTPAETYTYTGVAKMKFKDGTKKIYDITVPNCVPQIPSDFGTSSLDLQSYEIVFDCNADENGDFLYMVEHQAG